MPELVLHDDDWPFFEIKSWGIRMEKTPDGVFMLEQVLAETLLAIGFLEEPE